MLKTCSIKNHKQKEEMTNKNIDEIADVNTDEKRNPREMLDEMHNTNTEMRNVMTGLSMLIEEYEKEHKKLEKALSNLKEDIRYHENNYDDYNYDDFDDKA